MKRLFTWIGGVLVASVASAQSIGTPYCFGTACPCANNDPTAGCVNSTGQGALLNVTGTTSVAADDALFTLTRLPSSSVTLMVMSRTQAQVPFFDGLLCIGQPFHRMYQHQNSVHNGTVTFNRMVFRFQATNVFIVPGDTWNFQGWYRDAPASATPCHLKANTTNGVTLTFTP